MKSRILLALILLSGIGLGLEAAEARSIQPTEFVPYRYYKSTTHPQVFERIRSRSTFNPVQRRPFIVRPEKEEEATTPDSTIEFQKAYQRLNKDLQIKYTGNPHVDFLQLMLPHHDAASDFARKYLEHAAHSDPRVGQFAKEIIQFRFNKGGYMDEVLRRYLMEMKAEQ